MLFREDTYFRFSLRWWGITLGAVLFAGTVALLAARTLLGAGPPPGSLAAQVLQTLLATAIIAGFGAAAVFATLLKLQVEVNDRGLFVRLFPLQRKVRQIDLNNVSEVVPVDYRPLRDYGGYGLRQAPDGKAYHLRGQSGVRIDYENGYHVLIGAQDPEALADAIERVLGTPAA